MSVASDLHEYVHYRARKDETLRTTMSPNEAVAIVARSRSFEGVEWSDTQLVRDTRRPHTFSQFHWNKAARQ